MQKLIIGLWVISLLCIAMGANGTPELKAPGIVFAALALACTVGDGLRQRI